MTFYWTPDVKGINVVFGDGDEARLLNTAIITE